MFTTRIRDKGMERGICGQGKKRRFTIKGVYLHHPLLRKLNIEHFLLGCGTTKFHFPQRTSSYERYSENNSGVVRWEPSGKHAEEEGCMLSYISFPNTVSDANFFWRQRRCLTKYYFKMFIHCGSITPMGEHGRLRRTSKINVFELEIATLIFCIGSEFR